MKPITEDAKLPSLIGNHPLSASVYYALPLFSLLGSAGLWPFLDADQQAVALPLLALFNITLIFIVALSRFEKRLQVFELGAICAIATMLYSAVPLLTFLLNGL